VRVGRVDGEISRRVFGDGEVLVGRPRPQAPRPEGS
jgi:hypothetical protein